MSESLQHLDADSLSAFVEGVLPEHERVACLAHLAECAQCRAVAYLAEEPVTAPVAEKASWWERWFVPAAALTAAAAGVVVLSISLRVEPPLAKSPVAALTAPPKRAEPMSQALPGAAPPLAKPATAVRLLKVPTSVNAVTEIAQKQEKPSAIAGTVTDQAGAVIPGAAVSVRAANGPLPLTAGADASGQFRVAGLPPGQYELKVTAPGFQQSTKKVDVAKDQVARVDSALSVGSLSESVEVTASAPTIATESNRASEAMLVNGSVKAPLPAALSAKKGRVMLAVDSAGALLRSDNAGKKWKTVKAVWKGKVVGLAAVTDTPDSAFRLTTDTGVVWLSRDGSHWLAASK